MGLQSIFFLDASFTKFRTRQLYAWAFGVLLLCLFCIIVVDRAVLLWVHWQVPSELKSWFKGITQLGGAEYFLIPSALVYGFHWGMNRYRQKQRAFADTPMAKAVFFFSSVCLSGLVVNLLKIILGRYRPYYFLARDLYGFHFLNFKMYMNSFPSGHAQAVWSSMTALCILYPNLRIVAIPFAVLISVSRIFSKYHYCSDVLMGTFIGIVITIGVYRWFVSKGFLLKR